MYLHTRNPPIVHRDIRSYNIFIMSTDMNVKVNAKIGDFGLSVFSHFAIEEPLESWQWCAPEV
jgi:serine/threonine protein kinase